ncbi:schlafen family member 13 [Biomphalaria glabrata]|nr:schlafen family member 13 [Biomphalaria glabrata]
MMTSKDFERHNYEYGDLIVTCPVHISKGIHKKDNEQILQYSCALLNSGGGILRMKNIDCNCGTQSKSLDMWWSGMESNLATILSGDDICNYFDFVGNYDDEYFYLFVKSAEHLCTVDYNCRLPTDTATHCVTYKSAVKLCSTLGSSKSLSALPPIPTSFEYGQIEESLKQEGKQIQFKFLTTDNELTKRTLPEKVSFYCSRYISAFANHEGGHIYFGIEDSTAAVLGEEMNESDEARCTNLIQVKMKSIIWGDTRFSALKGVHWDIKFVPIFHCPNQQRRKVIVVSVCKMFGGVFTSCPESYMITKVLQSDSHYPKYGIRRLEFDEWKAELLNQSRDVKSLHSRFVKIPLRAPQSRLVFSLPHTLQAAREKVIKLSTGLNVYPKNILQSYGNETMKKIISKLACTFSEEPHLIISLEAWGLEIERPFKPPSVLSTLVVISSLYGLHLVCLVSNVATEDDVWTYAREIAVNFKKVLIQHGGCISHLGVKIHVLDINTSLILENFQGSIDVDIYPQTYKLREDNLDDILTALTIALASYKNLGAEKNTDSDYYFLLTCDQLELLWCHQFTKELWIHGPPGSGKTIAALEMIKEFRRRGCQKEEILYVAENPLLCSFISSFSLCQVVSRRELMADSSSPDIVLKKYSPVKNVVVDEAQNFKDRDGDWYSLLEKFSQQNVVDPKSIDRGYFWVFMDYAQKVHKFEAGLPGLIGKNNFMLREISRNSKEIYDYATKLMESSSGSSANNGLPVTSQLGHEYKSGQDVNVVKCNNSDLKDTLYKVLKQFTDMGVDLSDIAILVSKKAEAELIERAVAEANILDSIKKNAPDANTTDFIDGKFSAVPMETETNGPSKQLVISTVREFSGLDKPVVIGFDPHINQEHANMDKFLLNLVTRAKDSLVILTTSDQMANKLKIDN